MTDYGTDPAKSQPAKRVEVKSKYNFYPPPDSPVKQTQPIPKDVADRITQKLRKFPHR